MDLNLEMSPLCLLLSVTLPHINVCKQTRKMGRNNKGLLKGHSHKYFQGDEASLLLVCVCVSESVVGMRQ